MFVAGEVRTKEEHSIRHTFFDCPISVLGGLDFEMFFEMEWQMLRALPIPYDDLGSRFWQRVRTLHGESEFAKYNYHGKKRR